MMQSKLLMSSEHLYQIIEGYTANVLTVNNTATSCITLLVKEQTICVIVTDTCPHDTEQTYVFFRTSMHN